MPTSLAILHIFGGVVWLLMAGDLLVRGAVALARRAGISPLMVGLTIVAFGTSAPELVVTVRASLGGLPELAIGNVVGSNIANVLLVVGVPALVYPMACDQPGARRDGLVMLGATVLFVALSAAGPLGRGDGFVLLAGLGLFLVHAIRFGRHHAADPADSAELPRVLGLPRSARLIALFIVLGGVGLPTGAELLVRGAASMAETFGVPDEVIGLTVVAVGTSLPELATTLVAAVKREAEVAVGNVLGSNVINILAIMGAAAVTSPSPLPVPPAFLRLDLPLMLLAAGVLAWHTTRRATVGRLVGGTLVLGWVAYTVVLFRFSG